MADPRGNDAPAGGQRLDKWLWCARFFKSRALAAKACHDGRIRVSGQTLAKAHTALKVGDVLTFPLGANIRVVRVLALAMRRGPPAEARGLYEDLAADPTLPTSAAAATDGPPGRPAGGCSEESGSKAGRRN
jgi:ribosome-associated heat shock protein Hsp15